MLKNFSTIIGIDPGYDRLGWAIGEIKQKKFQISQYGCIQTNKKEALFKRYQYLQKELQKIVKQYKPQVAAIESLFFQNNQKTALKVSESRGIVIATFINSKLEIVEYTPLQIKETVTGYGRADKNAVNKMLRMQLALPQEKIIDDAMDAIGVAFTHYLRAK